MSSDNRIWLVTNSASGSNSPAALEALDACCGDNGFAIERTIRFPDEDLPDASALDAQGISRLAIYTGDGTLNACITRLYGWSGQIVVLPGGTMNLLSKRLHGDVELAVILERIAAGAGQPVRPSVVRTAYGDALAGLLAGPGTAWFDVREAMREVDIAGVIGSASDAMAETTGGSMLRCSQPALGRSEGYPLLEITPGEWGMQIDAFHSETAGEYLQQGWALIRRQFREGPHDRLGLPLRLTVADTQGNPVSLLVDGEKAGGEQAREEFVVAECEVDLLATQHAL